jgi:hypothetical protein
MEIDMIKASSYISAFIFIGGIVTAHFHGFKSTLDESRDYTDKKIEKMENKIDAALANQSIVISS